MGFTRDLVRYALNTKYEDIPESALEVQRHSLLDITGCMLGAWGLGEGCHEILKYIQVFGKGDCPIIGTDTTASPEAAALMNGSLAHALDFEDSQDIAMQHSNSVPTPLSYTIADMIGTVSGKEFLAAITIGSDIACRLATAFNEDQVRNGWYMQPVHGSMAGVLCGARLLGLTEDQTMDALAINTYMASGSAEVVNSKVSLIRAIRDGLASKSAMFSLLLAKSGIDARFEEAFEGKQGYLKAYTQGNYNVERAARNLGKEFLGQYTGFKPWACCRLTHPAVGALIDVMKENGLKGNDITHIHLILNPVCKMVTEPDELRRRPDNAATAKFSLPFSLGVAAKTLNPGLPEYEPEKLRDPWVLEFAKKVSFEYDETLDKAAILNNVYTIETTKGVFKGRVTNAFGSPERPMTEKMFSDKFKACASYALRTYSSDQLDEMIDTILHVERLNDVRKLTGML